VHRTAPGQEGRQGHGGDPLVSTNAHKGDSLQTVRAAPKETLTHVQGTSGGQSGLHLLLRRVQASSGQVSCGSRARARFLQLSAWRVEWPEDIRNNVVLWQSKRHHHKLRS
jgi:hypothetical protein